MDIHLLLSGVSLALFFWLFGRICGSFRVTPPLRVAIQNLNSGSTKGTVPTTFAIASAP